MDGAFVENLDEHKDAPPSDVRTAPPPSATTAGQANGVLPVEDVDDPDGYMPLHIDEIDDGDSASAASGDAGGGDDGGDDGGAAAAVELAPTAPRSLTKWPLPPSMTPKKRGSARAEVALDLDVQPAADGAWRCKMCEAAYDTRIGLFAHTRFCAGRAAAWRCEWCNCSELETNHKATGPNGIKTLCSACGQRYRHGAEGMPRQNEKGEWICSMCERGFPTMGALGGHRRFCDGVRARARTRRYPTPPAPTPAHPLRRPLSLCVCAYAHPRDPSGLPA